MNQSNKKKLEENRKGQNHMHAAWLRIGSFMVLDVWMNITLKWKWADPFQRTFFLYSLSISLFLISSIIKVY